MLWLAVHMWFLLFTAFAIGIGIGWWIWGTRTNARPPAPPQKRDAPMGTLNIDYDISAETPSVHERSR